MLKLILGKKLTGKTTKLLQIAENLVLNSQEVIMLVPEQYSFECQRLLLKKLGPKLSNNINILSFTGLCDEISNVYGGKAGVVVDDSTRFLLMREAVISVKDSLKLYTRYVESTDFIKKILAVVSEFKQAGVSPEQLNIDSNISNASFEDKLHDIRIIMTSYDALVKNKFIEPLDAIEKAIRFIPNGEFFNGKTVIIDEFKGFTGAQFKLLEKIIIGSSDTIISFCVDSLLESNDTDIFKNVKKSANKLINIAKSHGVWRDDITYLNENHYTSLELAALESFIANDNAQMPQKCDNLCLFKAANIQSETDFVMRNIRRLVREKGYRYNDFLIVSRTSEFYSDYIINSAEKYGVPCFTDFVVPISTLPFTNFILSALKAVKGFDTENILCFAKCGILDITFDEISEVENYAYVWNIGGKKWLDNWDMNPDGLRLKSSPEYLDKINLNRKKIIEPLYNFKNKLFGTVTDMCKAIISLIDDCNAVKGLKKYTDGLTELGRLNEAGYQGVGYDALIDTIDKIVCTVGEKTIKLDEFIELFSASVGFKTVGSIPKTLDQVLYGTADRVRPFEPKVVFAIGVNQDVFPMMISDTGVFSRREREFLINNGAQISDSYINSLIDEKYLFYNTVCCAKDMVFLSCCLKDNSGKPCSPDFIFKSIESESLCNKYSDDSETLNIDKIEVKGPAFEHLLAGDDYNDAFISTLKAYFENDIEYSKHLNLISAINKQNEQRLSHESANMLYGQNIKSSASKIEDFNGCKYLYFCKYGLNVKPIKKVEFDSLTRGNIIHYCLEKFISNHKNDIGHLDYNLIKEKSAELCDQYIAQFNTNNEAFDDKFIYMLGTVKATVNYLLNAINNEFSVSFFRPKFCELDIGKGKTVDALTVKTAFGNTLSIEGSIDRVDTTADGKVRVVDYKSGGKEFDLSKVLSGLNMQMLIYLYAVIKNGKDVLEANTPAGILYFPAKRQIKDVITKNVKMNGLLVDDYNTLEQMDKDFSNSFIPASLKVDGSVKKNKSLIPSEYFETIFKYVDYTLSEIGNSILRGEIDISPLKDDKYLKCDYCDYRSVCKISDTKNIRTVEKLSNDETIARMIEQTEVQ